MKINTKTLVGTALLAAFSTAAPTYAAPISDTVDPTNTLITFGATPSPCPLGFTCTTSSLSFVHDITDNGFNLGDTVNSGFIDIHLTEFIRTGTNNETYRYDIGTQTFSCLSGNCVPNPGVTNNIVLAAASIDDLEADGKITVKVTALSGDFFFADSTLLAEVTAQVIEVPTPEEDVPTPSQEVPTPSTVLLLGGGLAGFGWRFRRRR